MLSHCSPGWSGTTSHTYVNWIPEKSFTSENIFALHTFLFGSEDATPHSGDMSIIHSHFYFRKQFAMLSTQTSAHRTTEKCWTATKKCFPPHAISPWVCVCVWQGSLSSWVTDWELWPLPVINFSITAETLSTHRLTGKKNPRLHPCLLTAFTLLNDRLLPDARGRERELAFRL